MHPNEAPRSAQPSSYSDPAASCAGAGQFIPPTRVGLGRCGDDARTKQTGIDAARLLRALFDEDDFGERSTAEPLDFQIMLRAERLRQLAGMGGRVSVILTVPDKKRFDEINFQGQTHAECQHHGVNVKALFSPLWRILVLHSAKEPAAAL